jgi:hypothetical protein
MLSLFHLLQDPMCSLCELCALKLYDDVERYLENGFAEKEENGYEPMETLSVAVPLLGCDSVALPMQHSPPCLSCS